LIFIEEDIVEILFKNQQAIHLSQRPNMVNKVLSKATEHSLSHIQTSTESTKTSLTDEHDIHFTHSTATQVEKSQLREKPESFHIDLDKVNTMRRSPSSSSLNVQHHLTNLGTFLLINLLEVIHEGHIQIKLVLVCINSLNI
jgi:hypothetical protein